MRSEDDHCPRLTTRGSLRLFAAVYLALLGLTSPAPGQQSPHGKLRFQCEECHTSADWKKMTYPSKFKHAKTGFALKGQHEAVKCTACHTSLKFAVSGKRCADCHKDVHSAELGAACDRCHSPDSWVVPDMIQRHTKTRFSLVGAHATASCESCHKNQSKHQYVGARTDCFGCHGADYEASKSPAHRAAGFTTDCASCHIVNAARWGGSFDHARTGFPLTGAHTAVACAQCHVGNKFQGTAAQCSGCHMVQFTAAQSPSHAGFSTNCTTCHTMAAWQPATFDHNKTAFALVGAHQACTCQQCHVNNVFKGTASTCFGCHQADFTNAKNPSHTGFSNACATCHTSTSWHPASFDHNKTAFPLVGAHTAVVCAQCHVNNVFKGTPTLCFTCHQAQFTSAVNPLHTGFPTDCSTCHTMVAGWRPATFDHSKTAFPLLGAHTAVVCAQCHVNNVYKGTPTLCFTCHQTQFTNAKTPVHTGFPTDCSTCHTMVAGWRPATFDHSKTAFPLLGAHTAVVCAQCHVNNVYKGTPTLCFTCHQTQFTNAKTPVHTGFPTDCSTCHTMVAGWRPATFDHNKTAFPLVGAHTAVVCAQCHVNNVYKGTPTLCFTCHQSQFTGAVTPPHTGFPTDCQTCHTMVAGWRPATFDHSKTAFPLTGAHMATPCSGCHKNNVYKGTSTLCYTCHQSNFTTAVNPPHTGFPTDCSTCHASTAWRPSTFDHSKTIFPLTGAHMAVACNLCHKNNVYVGTTTLCLGCHQSNFATATNPSHTGFSTVCSTCHSTSAWQPASFDHSKTNFPLTGAHMPVACALCHINGVYKGTPMTCGNVACHLPKYNATTNPKHTAAQFGTDCQTCHSTTAWVPSSFNHTTFFPIAAGARHSPGVWTLCTDCHTTATDYSQFSCIQCHAHSNKTSVDNSHNGNARYTYTATSCYTCHSRG